MEGACIRDAIPIHISKLSLSLLLFPFNRPPVMRDCFCLEDSWREVNRSFVTPCSGEGYYAMLSWQATGAAPVFEALNSAFKSQKSQMKQHNRCCTHLTRTTTVPFSSSLAIDLSCLSQVQKKIFVLQYAAMKMRQRSSVLCGLVQTVWLREAQGQQCVRCAYILRSLLAQGACFKSKSSAIMQPAGISRLRAFSPWDRSQEQGCSAFIQPS